MIKIKDDSVKMSNVHPKIYWAMSVVAEIYADVDTEMVITSCRDAHPPTSLHYHGKAFDIRIWNLPKSVKLPQLTGRIASALGDEFDVVLELAKSHIHIEYDID